MIGHFKVLKKYSPVISEILSISENKNNRFKTLDEIRKISVFKVRTGNQHSRFRIIPWGIKPREAPINFFSPLVFPVVPEDKYKNHDENRTNKRCQWLCLCCTYNLTARILVIAIIFSSSS
jgi:hypothetical protein